MREIGSEAKGATTAAASVSRVDPQHGDDEGDHHAEIAEEDGEDARQRLLDEGEIRGEALGQRRRALAPELGDVGVDEMGIERALHVGLDARHHLVGEHRAPPQRSAADRRQHDDEDGPEEERLLVLLLEGVEGLLDEQRIGPGRRRDDGDEEEDERERSPVRPHPFAPQAHEGRQGVSRDEGRALAHALSR